MAQSQPPRALRVLVFGTGGIGMVYSMILNRTGIDLACICRSNYAAAKEKGFIVNSTIFNCSETFHPTIYSSVEEATSGDDTPYDYILVTTKAFPRQTDNHSVQSLIAPIVSPLTAIVLIQNGIGVEQPYRDRFPHNPIISCVAYLPTTQTTPGVVHHTEVERLQLGTFPATEVPKSHLDAAATFAAILQEGGATVEVYPDVQVARWRKLIGNASWNTICALSQCRDREFLRASPYATELVRGVMEEVVSVARAVGYASDIGMRDVIMQVDRSAARNWPGVEPSMLADLRRDKPMEVDAIVGEVVYLGQKQGVSIPRLECLYTLITGLSWSRAQDDR